MRLEQSGVEKQVRFDRVLVHGLSEQVLSELRLSVCVHAYVFITNVVDWAKVVPSELRLLGTSELPINISPRSPLSPRRDSLEEVRFATSVFPSDHFGIMAEIMIQ